MPVDGARTSQGGSARNRCTGTALWPPGDSTVRQWGLTHAPPTTYHLHVTGCGHLSCRSPGGGILAPAMAGRALAATLRLGTHAGAVRGQQSPRWHYPAPQYAAHYARGLSRAPPARRPPAHHPIAGGP